MTDPFSDPVDVPWITTDENQSYVPPVPSQPGSPFLPVSNTSPLKLWHMLVEETVPGIDRGTRIVGQFVPTEVTHTTPSNIVEAGGYNRAAPLIQWTGKGLEQVSFKARLFSMHFDDQTAAKKLEEIRLISSKHTNLGRPPLVRFFWGTVFPDGFLCLVSVDSAAYDENRGADGSLRGVTLDITLRKYTPYRFEQVTAETQTGRTPSYIAHHGETYEMIALDQYGDPLLGVLLRQWNPRYPMVKTAPKSVADLSPGDKVKIYRIDEISKAHIQPMCHVLRQDNNLAANNRRAFFMKRSREIMVVPSR